MDLSDKVKGQAAATAKAMKAAAATHATAARDAAAAQTRIVLADLWHAIRTERTAQIMVAVLVVCLICWELPYAKLILYPFKLFVTMIHEACHALAARATGGNVAFISIAPDESGLTGTIGGLRPLVIMAGYLGTSIFGGLLIWWGRNPVEARSVLQTIGCVLLSLTVFYGGGGWFSFISMLIIASAVVLISRKASQRVCHMFLLMVAVITTLEALISIQDLFLISALSGGATDAKSMEGLTGVPAVVWSILWGLVSLVVLVFAFWFSYRPSRVIPGATMAAQSAGADPSANGSAPTESNSQAN